MALIVPEHYKIGNRTVKNPLFQNTLKIPTTEEKYQAALQAVGDGVGPGRVIIMQLKVKEQVSGGGIVKPVTESRNRATIWGRVVCSGSFMMNNRTPVDVKGWPLPAGMYVEVVDLNHWDTTDGHDLTVIRAEDVVRWSSKKPACIED